MRYSGICNIQFFTCILLDIFSALCSAQWLARAGLAHSTRDTYRISSMTPEFTVNHPDFPSSTSRFVSNNVMQRLAATIMTAAPKRVPIPRRGVDYRGKIVLAPMVRSGELPSRLLALHYGADLVWGMNEIVCYLVLADVLRS